MSKVAIVLSGDQVVFTHVVPDNSHVIFVPIGTQATPVAQPAPATTFNELMDAPPAATEPREVPSPGSRNGYAWNARDKALAESDLTDQQVADRTGRSTTAIGEYRRTNGLRAKVSFRKRGPQSPWTEEEEKTLLELAGPDPRPGSADYQDFVEFFPRHPKAGALRQKHYRLLGV